MVEGREDSRLTQLYEGKGVAEIELHGVMDKPPIGQDLWIAQQIRGAKIVLDIGCGHGKMARLLVTELCGIDISPGLVKLAIQNGYAKAAVCDIGIEKVPYEDGYFDAAICMDVLEHLVDPVHALAEINRVLKTGGILGVTTPNIAFFVNRLALLFGHHMDTFEIANPSLHLRFFTFNSFTRLLDRTGFRVKKVGGYPIGDWRLRRSALWRYPLWLLAKLRPQVFAREIVLTAEKFKQPEQSCWQYPPAGSIKGVTRLKNLWHIT